MHRNRILIKLQRKYRLIFNLSVFAFIGQVRVQHDNAKISMYHIVIFREKGHSSSHKKAEKHHGTNCHII